MVPVVGGDSGPYMVAFWKREAIIQDVPVHEILKKRERLEARKTLYAAERRQHSEQRKHCRPVFFPVNPKPKNRSSKSKLADTAPAYARDPSQLDMENQQKIEKGIKDGGWCNQPTTFEPVF